MPQSGEEFVRAAMRDLGVETAAQLAEKMRWKRGTERLVAKWLSGQNDPSYTYTMELLEKTGRLSKRIDRRAEPPAQADPLAALGAAVGEMALVQAAIARHLGVPPAEFELPGVQPSQRQETPRRRRAG